MARPSTKVESQPQKRRVLLVDDHPVVCEGLTKRINTEADLVVCGEARTPAGALREIANLKPDVVVVDLALSEGHGLELIKDIRARDKQLPVLVFTMFEESNYALRVLQAGAHGYVMKQESSDRLIESIRTVLKGNYAMSQQASNTFLRAFLDPSAKRSPATTERLGDRELEVFELIGKGLGTREIAERLGRSIKTVETYRERIKKKLQLKDAPALMREAVRHVESRGRP